MVYRRVNHHLRGLRRGRGPDRRRVSRSAALPDDCRHLGPFARRVLSAREGDPDGRDRPTEVVEGRGRHRREAARSRARPPRPSRAAARREQARRSASEPGPCAGAVDEAPPSRGTGRAPARPAGGRASTRPHGRQLGRQPDAHVGHEGHGVARLLLEQVERLGPVQHAEVGRRPTRSTQPREQRPGQPLQRVVAQVRRAELEDADAQPVAPLLGQVGDEAVAPRARPAAGRRSTAAGRAPAPTDAAGSGAGWRARTRRTATARVTAGTCRVGRSSRAPSPQPQCLVSQTAVTDGTADARPVTWLR